MQKPTQIIKRDGRIVSFDLSKIKTAIIKAANAAEDSLLINDSSNAIINNLADEVISSIEPPVTVEKVQDAVEAILMKNGYFSTAKAYIIYRANRTEIRESNTTLMKKLNELNTVSAIESNLKRDNANIDGNSSMGTMLQMGTAASKEYYAKYFLNSEQKKAHQNGDIHIHDFDFYGLTTTCCQIDLGKLFHNGFSTGHGYLREPQSIASYAALAAIAIQSNQNDQHGGQSIPAFDYFLAPGVSKTYRKEFFKFLTFAYEDTLGEILLQKDIERILKECENHAGVKVAYTLNEKLKNEISHAFADTLAVHKKYTLGTFDCYFVAEKLLSVARKRAEEATEKATYQAMEGFIHNLNTMHSRAGAQTPFSSINFGTDTSKEGRLVSSCFLKAEEAGLGNGETPIFPISIFKVKEGVNYNKTDPNYDLMQLACKVSAKRLFPNFSFIDSPFNLQYYAEGKPETEVAYMGCRTRVMGNICDPGTHDSQGYHPNGEVAYSRGNLSFTSINLPRLAIKAKGDESAFYKALTTVLELVEQQLLDRFEIQAKRKVYNYPFLMEQGVWKDADKLSVIDEVREVLKHGTLSIGFIGLAETLTALYGHHHGENDEMQAKGLQIVKFMRNFADEASNRHKMNFSLLATPAEGLSGRFVRMDRQEFGILTGITDKEYYTNSFHVPVWYKISVYDKINKEAPYHALTNAGHISYVELDGNTASNPEALESIVRCMHDAGIGYGSINHPVDRDPVCGYIGVIGETCPRCGRKSGEGLSEANLEKLRREYPNAPIFFEK